MINSYVFPPETPGLDWSAAERTHLGFADRRSAFFVKRGFLVSIPFGKNRRYDPIADDGERMLRTQGKTGRLKAPAIWADRNAAVLLTDRVSDRFLPPQWEGILGPCVRTGGYVWASTRRPDAQQSNSENPLG